MIDKAQVQRDRQESVRLGQIAREGKDSAFWVEILKPTIESIIRGITDISSIDISSEKKASVELAGRKLAAKYFQEIETLIDGFIIDANTVLDIVEKQNNKSSLYKVSD